MYVRQYTAGSILRNTFQIYWRHFSTIFLTYALPLVPCALLTQEALIAEQRTLFVIGLVLQTIVGLFAYGAITVSISDLCLGHRPNLLRSYRRLFSRLFWKYLYTILLQLLVVLLGLILFIFPGLIAVIWLTVTFPVIILERITGVAALKRSRHLVQNYAWKVAGVLLLLIAIAFTVGALVGALRPVLGMLFPGYSEHFGRFVFALLANGFSTPITLIALVLVYYDLRVRKEAYDTTVLAQELRR